jgi:uncharacterized protein YdgA (DUF945 family)
MATVSPAAGYPLDIQGDGSVLVFRFTGLTTTNADTAPIPFAQWADRSVQIDGTWGTGGSASVEGSNDGTNYFILNNAQNTAATLTANGLKQIVEVPRYARVRVTAGDGTTNLNATIVLRLANPLRT